jgi:hypothetical protein
MKSLFKRSAIGMIVLGMAGATNAATPYNYNMWSPHFSGVFIGIDGLYLRPLNGDLDYVTTFPTSSAGYFYTTAISTDYHWDWRLYGGVKFSDNDDITLSWTRLRPSDHDTVNSYDPESGSAARFLFSDEWDVASAHVDFDLDQFYAVWGHTICFNNPWSVRYAGGIEYARLESDLSVNSQIFGDVPVGYTAHSRFSGWGPRVEFNMTYHLPYNFALFADANAALLVSSRKLSLAGNQTFSTEEDWDNLIGAYYSTRHVVIPNFGTRLGVSYAYSWGQAGAEGCGSCTALTFSLGWQVDSYIHAIERPHGNTFYDDTEPSSGGGFFSSRTSNFGDSGLFLGVKLSSDWL